MRALLIPAMLSLTLISAQAGDVSGKGPNGGRLADTGNMHVEFLTKGGDISVYTFDHDNKPVPSAGTTGRVTVQEKGATRSVQLAAQAPNKLAGKLDQPLSSGARAILSLTPKGEKPVQARFTAD